MKTSLFSHRLLDYAIALLLSIALFGLAWIGFLRVSSTTPPITPKSINLSALLTPQQPNHTPKAPTHKPQNPKSQTKPQTNPLKTNPTPKSSAPTPKPSTPPAQKVLKEESAPTPPPLQTSQISDQPPSEKTIFLDGVQDDAFLIAIQRGIQNNVSTPKLARYKKISGTVILEFYLSSKEGLSKLKIIRSSGHTLLDENAMRTIEKASKDFPSPPKSYKLRIPIKYLP